MSSVSVFLINAYQIVGSPIMGGGCRFYPSCSCYGKEAFEKHPPLRAFKLTFLRILRCRPLGPKGLDPVPEPKVIHE